MASPTSTGKRAGGFTYLGLLVLLFILGMVAAAGLKAGSLMQRAAAEQELLEIGAQFSEALRSYAAATPKGQPQQPPTLADLLKDPRFPNPRRHLRKIFVDPITGRAEWGVIYLADDKGVTGVHSLSDQRPLKLANFDARFMGLENKEKLSDWHFMMAGGEGATPPPPVPPKSGGAPESLFDAAGKPPPLPPMEPTAPPPEPEEAAPPEKTDEEEEADAKAEEDRKAEEDEKEDPNDRLGPRRR